MLDKIDIRDIFRDHFSTLKDYDTEEFKKIDFILFFGIPFLVAPALVVWYGTLPITVIVVIGTSLSVFASLLLNLFVLTFNTVLKSEPMKNSSVRKDLALEINSNIAFAIVIALIIIVLVLYFGIAHDSIPKVYVEFLTGFIYYLGILFGLKILMLLKRIYILLKVELVHLDC